ncbi:MAG TPA: hypothetical protein VIX86_05445 [Streptosporangiaceae bacterium]
MASVKRLERDAPPLRIATVDHLEQLASLLTQRGLDTSLVAPLGRVPRLQVAHPAATSAAGDIYAARGQDGNWWFWWSWAERIASEDDLDGAAARIEQELARPGGG